MKKHGSRTGSIMMAAGILLILLALCYLAGNLWEEYTAGSTSQRALEQMRVTRVAAQASAPEATAAPVPVTAGDAPQTDIPAEPTAVPPLYVQYPDMEMPEVEIDGQKYIGTVTIPKLGLELPVISQWSYPRLKLAPCRYSGSVYQDDMIILGHNYERHFRRFTDVETGDEVLFTDMDGNVFRYVVTLKEQLRGNDTERMLEGEWDLTLFTCARGGKKRITLRCDRVEE